MVTIRLVVVDVWVQVTLAPSTRQGERVVKSVVKVKVSPLLGMVALVSNCTSMTLDALTMLSLCATVMMRCEAVDTAKANSSNIIFMLLLLTQSKDINSFNFVSSKPYQQVNTIFIVISDTDDTNTNFGLNLFILYL